MSSFSSAEPECKDQEPPRVILLSPLCQDKHTTLVCLAQGFPYKWPLDVTWSRNGQKVPLKELSVATEPAQEQERCSFSTASRLRVPEKEWQESHNYSCQVSQIDQAPMDFYLNSKPGRKAAPASDISEVQLSLRAGQFAFLLLGAKSLAYSAALGIYIVYRKTGL